MTTRGWQELVNDDDALPLIREWIAASPFDVRELPVSTEDGRRTLEALQVTTRSALGALALHTGGLLVDHGWLRVLGGGCAQLPRALDRWNGIGGALRCEEGLLVADDVVGGFFAWFREPRTVHYLAPDSLEWEDSGLGHTDWVSWCLTERLKGFYESLRWPGWAGEIASLPGESGLLVYPPLFAAGPALAARDRKPVPVEELWTLTREFQRQLADVPNGAPVRFVAKP